MPAPKDPEKRTQFIERQRLAHKGKKQTAAHRIKNSKDSESPRVIIQCFLDALLINESEKNDESLSAILDQPVSLWYSMLSIMDQIAISGAVGFHIAYRAVKKIANGPIEVHYNAVGGSHDPDLVFQYQEHDVAVEVKYWPGTKPKDLGENWPEEKVLNRFNNTKYLNHVKLLIIFCTEDLLPILSNLNSTFRERAVSVCPIYAFETDIVLGLLDEHYWVSNFADPLGRGIIDYIEQAIYICA